MAHAADGVVGVLEAVADLAGFIILEGKANVVMSDMAASSSGHKKTDHLRIMALCETAAYFAFDFALGPLIVNWPEALYPSK